MIAYNNNGQLVTLASGQRMWIGTTAAHEAAIQAGTMPNNCTVAIIDEAQSTLSNLIVTENITGTGITITTNPTSWSISATKAGYKPIAYTVKGNNSADITWGIEQDTFGDGTFSCQGFAKSADFTGTLTPVARVTWMKI